MTVDFTAAVVADCPLCGQRRRLGQKNGFAACLDCHAAGEPRQEPPAKVVRQRRKPTDATLYGRRGAQGAIRLNFRRTFNTSD